MKNIKISSIVCLAAVLVNFFAFSNTVYAAPAITVVDLTGLATGAETSHDCNKYITTKYDASQHWQECTVCGKIVGSKSNHNLHTTGAYGCAITLGYQYNSCSCGYSVKVDKKSHTPNNIWRAFGDRAFHYEVCSDCGIEVERRRCVNELGQYLGCLTGISGTCVICGAYRDGSHHSAAASDYDPTGTKSLCLDCGKEILRYTALITPLSETSVKYTFYITTQPNIILNLEDVYGGSCQGTPGTWTNIEAKKTGDNTYIASGVVTFDKIELPYPTSTEVHLVCDYEYNGYWTTVHLGRIWANTDNTAPSYISSNMTYSNTVGAFATKAILNIQYKETYDSNVYIRVIDSDNLTVISDWGACTKNETTFTRNVDLTDEVYGTKIIYVQAKDSTGNTSALTAITVSNLDSKAPTQTSSMETSQNWSKTKDFTFTATDIGAGNVQIAFNNVNDYVLATRSGITYSRNYRFTGDVYGSVTAAVYYKDAVGNEVTKFIKVHNLDNTAPNIQRTEKILSGDKVKIMVTANDINTALNASGSGVNGYAITTSSSIPAVSSFQSTNGLEVIKNGIYYVWAKDAVGNISRYTMVKVTELVADYTVNHFKQDVYGNYPAIPDETYKTKGDIGTSVTPPVNKYEGFISPEAQTIIIKADGSSKVNYYYERTKVTLDINGEYLLKQYVDQLDSEAQKKYYSNLGMSSTDTNNNMGTFDVYINNILVADDVRDYYSDQILYGSTWEVRDIKPDAGKHYYGADIN